MKRFPAAAALLAAVLLLAGCSASGSSNDAGSSVTNPGTGAATGDGTTKDSGILGAPQAGDAAGSATSGTVAGSTSEVASGQRDVIMTGSMSVTAKDPIKATQDAVTITEQAGGRIDSRTENPATDNQPASATLTLRIPAAALDRTVTDLKKLGTLNYVSLNASDITQQTQDLDARITALKTSVDRLLSLMQQATTTTDLIAIEGTLSQRQADLESLQSQRNFLSDQVDFSTITLSLYSTGTVAPGAPGDFWTAIGAGWAAMVGALGAALVGIGYALPWIALLGVTALIVILIVRMSRRKGKAA
ncbi:DUF4349 domain-containing protein [Cryobacterium glucosi]|uniref:DUF4349 domain-containing protein n=1 Tax=Cryobacterium glucosi TaxID=1259175 RepID=A0ABY2ILI5_9MICO|nr:DUF4349 domain-containing protein [Cryobacterium glucosi]TFC20290.1 DUF4349 domain-containing protein [Cryobacterium glucosi]